MLVDERLLTHNGIDLAPGSPLNDLQDIPLLLFSADFPERSVGGGNRKVWFRDGSVMLKGLEALIASYSETILYLSQ